MKTKELLQDGIRYNRELPVMRRILRHADPSKKGAYAPSAWDPNTQTFEPTSNYLKVVKEPVYDREGKLVTKKPYYDPHFKPAARTTGELTRAGKAGEGYIKGATGDWLNLMGATPSDLPEALKLVRASPEYKALIELGFEEKSTPASEKDGILFFIGEIPLLLGRDKSEPLFFRVYPNGKIRSLPRTEKEINTKYGRPLLVLHPFTKETHPDLAPVERVAKTMVQSIQKLTKVVQDIFRRSLLAKHGS